MLSSAEVWDTGDLLRERVPDGPDTDWLDESPDSGCLKDFRKLDVALLKSLMTRFTSKRSIAQFSGQVRISARGSSERDLALWSLSVTGLFITPGGRKEFLVKLVMTSRVLCSIPLLYW